MSRQLKQIMTNILIAGRFALAALLLVPLASLRAATQIINNSTLSVMYDGASGRFIVAEKTTGKVFLTNGRLEGEAVKAVVVRQKIVVTQTDGSTVSLELRENQPVVFVTKQQMGRNTDKLDRQGPGYLEVTNAVLTTFTLDLGKPAAELKTMGTGGLRAPGENPGSYLFLTCADPATRRGVVAGWVTEDRGSGVLVTKSLSSRSPPSSPRNSNRSDSRLSKLTTSGRMAAISTDHVAVSTA